MTYPAKLAVAVMSQQPSPFSRPPAEPQASRPLMSTSAVLAICVTLLLICSGAFTTTYFAVVRLADELNLEDGFDYEFEEQEVPIALQHSLADVQAVEQRVGKISRVQINERLTYDVHGDAEQYYYDVYGRDGSVTVAAWLAYEEADGVWFERLALVDSDGNRLEELPAAVLPFDSATSAVVLQTLEASPKAAERVGAIKEITTVFDTDASENSDDEQFFDVESSRGSFELKVHFTDNNLNSVRSVSLIGTDGTETEQLIGPETEPTR